MIPITEGVWFVYNNQDTFCVSSVQDKFAGTATQQNTVNSPSG